MSESILDGTGRSYEAKVDETNRLEVRSVSENGAIEALGAGDHYAITSGSITLTAATESGVLYFINDEEYPIFVDRIIINAVDSTGGTVDAITFRIHKNPTGMTSGAATDATQVNTNFGSSNQLAITSEKGAEGATVDGGSTAGSWQIENPTRMRIIPVRLFIPKGASLGFSVTPPASNTSMAITTAVNAHLIKHDV